jgi:membrane-bound lytic murein transglycosylase C
MDDSKSSKPFLAAACLSIILPILGLASFAHGDTSGFLVKESSAGERIKDSHVPEGDANNDPLKYWQPLEQPNAKLWLVYSDDYMTKRVVDFEQEQVRISYQGKALAGSTPYTLQQDVERFLQINLADAYGLGGTFPKLMGKSPRANQSFLNLTRRQAESLYFSAQINSSKGALGDVLTITINLPADSLQKRSEVIQPIVDKLADSEDVSPALVMAIIHEENAFNLLARTSQPRFGLMMLGPDQTEGVHSEVIYNPELNIEMGIQKLSKLEQQFSDINDEQSRQLCVIAAYRVGIDEVVRTFTGRDSLSQALPLINKLSSRQIRGQLRSQLTLREGGAYVQQVSSFLALYE